MLRLSETTDTIRDVNNPSISKPLYASRGETQSSEKVQRLIIGLVCRNIQKVVTLKRVISQPFKKRNIILDITIIGKVNYLQSGDYEVSVLTIKDPDTSQGKKRCPNMKLPDA